LRRRWLGSGRRRAILVPAVTRIGANFTCALGALATLPLLALLVLVLVIVTVARGHPRLATIIAPVVLRSRDTSHERRDG
jgi:hypothetical protein